MRKANAVLDWCKHCPALSVAWEHQKSSAIKQTCTPSYCISSRGSVCLHKKQQDIAMLQTTNCIVSQLVRTSSQSAARRRITAAARTMLKLEEAPDVSPAAAFTSALIVPPTAEATVSLSIWLTSWLAADGALFTFVSTFAVVTGAFATLTSPPSSEPSAAAFAEEVWTAAACSLSATVIVTSTLAAKRLPAPKRLEPLSTTWTCSSPTAFAFAIAAVALAISVLSGSMYLTMISKAFTTATGSCSTPVAFCTASTYLSRSNLRGSDN